MKNMARIVWSYMPPILILAFLLLSNLFTRNDYFRSLLFPEQSVRISAAIPDDTEESIPETPGEDSLVTLVEDSAHCADKAYIIARDSIEKGRYDAAIAVLRNMVDSSTCSRSFLFNTLGIVLLRSKKYHDAETAFTDAIKADSTNGIIWYNRGVCRSRLNRSSQSIPDYRHAVQLDKNLSSAHFNLGILLLRNRKYEESRQSFKNALESGCNKSTAWYNIGLTLQYQDSIQAALRAYRESIRYAPGSTAPRLRMAALWIDTKKMDSAEAIMHQAAAISPEDPEVNLRLARIATDRHDYDKAFDCLDIILSKYPDYTDALYEKARIYGVRGNDREALVIYEKIMARDPANPRVYYNIGVNLMDLGKQQDAIAAYARALKVDPTFWKAAYNLGVHFLKVNRPVDAVAYFTKVVQTMPEKSGPQYNLGLAYLKGGNISEAKRAFSHAVYLDSNHIESWYNLGVALMKDGQLDSAATVFSSVLARKKNHAKSYFNLGLIARRSGQSELADSLFAKAIACKGNNYPIAWYNRALNAKKSGDFLHALEYAGHIVAKADSESIFAKAILLRTELFDTLGMTDSATACLKLADSLNRDDPEALEELADYYTRHNDIDHMRTIYRRILSRSPDNIAILLGMADMEESKYGNPDSALVYYRRVVKADPENPEVLKRAGMFMMSIKKFDDARTILTSAIALDPGSIDIRTTLAILYARENKIPDYEREISKLKSLVSSTAKPSFEAGKLLYQADFLTDAISFLDKARQADQKNPEYRYFYLAAQEKNIKTDKSFEKEWVAFTRDFPGDARGWYQLGREYCDLGNIATAIAAFSKSLSIREYKDTRYQLAQVYMITGNPDSARSELALYLKANPTDKKGRALYEKLTQN
jgi:superkiller protein 3